MTKDEQYKIIFESWKKYTSVSLNEEPLYQYSGKTDPETGDWIPGTVTSSSFDKNAPTDDNVENVDVTNAAATVFSMHMGASVAGKLVDPENIKTAAQAAAAVAGLGLYKILKGKRGIAAAGAGTTAVGRTRFFGKLLKFGVRRITLPVAVGFGLWELIKRYNSKPKQKALDGAVSGPEDPKLDEKLKKIIDNTAAKLNEAKKWTQEQWDKQEPGIKEFYCRLLQKLDPTQKCGSSDKKSKSKGGHSSLDKEELKGTISVIPGTNIQHNLTGEKKRLGELFVTELIASGITNEYTLAGAMATQGKETSFTNVAERARYTFKHLTDPKTTMHKKVTRLFTRHGLGKPKDRHWEKLSSDRHGDNGPIALLNLVYGYSAANVKQINYQGSREITIPILINNELNPDLYGKSGKKLAGWNYRGRGPLQTTFGSTYESTARQAGLNVQQILDDPDLLSTNSTIGARMSAAYSINPYKGIVKSHGKPKNLEEGIRVMVQIAGAPFAKGFPPYLNKTLARAIDVANRHIRIIDNQVASK